MPKWGFPDLLSSCGHWRGLYGQQLANKSALLDHTSPPPSSHHCLLACYHSPLSTATAISINTEPGFRLVVRPVALSLRKHIGCPVSRQAAHAPSTRPATSTVVHTPAVEGGLDKSRGGQKGVGGDASRRLADARCNLCNACDGGIIIVAVPSSRQGAFLLPSHHSRRRIHHGSLPLFVARTWLDV